MFNKKEIIMLKNVCERLRTDNRMLRERIAENNEAQARIDSQRESAIKLFRKLCEKILATDNKQMVLGCDFSFDDLSNKEICQKAIDALNRFIEQSTENMKEMLDKYKKQGEELDGLKLQFARMLNDEEQVVEEIDEAVPKPRAAESKKDMLEVDMYKVGDVADKFNDLAWLIIEVLGVYGLSLRKEVIDRCGKIAQERNMNAKYSTLSRELKALTTIPDLLVVEKIRLPASGNVDVIELDRIGKAVFEYKFNQTAADSEAKLIRKEHDNLTHGYGIVCLGRTLSERNIFNSVDYMNKGKGIEVTVDGFETVYVPDLVCKDKYGNRYYYEYELANHNMKNFRYKCDKMAQVSSVLRFVVPNKETAGQLKPKIQNWINHRGQLRLSDTRVEVHTYMSLVEGKLPTLEYDLNKSAAPVRDWT